jgi:hypothetical protein
LFRSFAIIFNDQYATPVFRHASQSLKFVNVLLAYAIVSQTDI